MFIKIYLSYFVVGYISTPTYKITEYIEETIQGLFYVRTLYLSYLDLILFYLFEINKIKSKYIV